MLWLGSTWNRRHGSTLTSRSDDYRGRRSTNLNPRPTSEQAYGDHLSASLLFYFYNFSHAEKEQKELLPILASFVSISFVSKTFLQGPCKWLLTCFSLRAALLFPESARHVSQILGSWNWLFSPRSANFCPSLPTSVILTYSLFFLAFRDLLYFCMSSAKP